MTTPLTTIASQGNCCAEHDGPHVHGCRIGRVDDVTHRGACLTDAAAAARWRAAEERRLAALPVPRVAHIEVALVDDYEAPSDGPPVRYERPHALEIVEACAALTELEQLGELPPAAAGHVRVLLATVGRLSSDGVARAFSKPGRRHLRVAGGEA